MRTGRAFSVCVSSLCLPAASLAAKEISPADLPKDVTALYHMDKNCFDLSKAKLPQSIITDDMGDNTTLYIIPCSFGAYNIFSKIYLRSGSEIEEVFFADYNSSYGWTGTNLLVNISYDEKTKRLTSFNKSAGHGWCGNAGIWQWKDYDFQMITFSSHDDCDNDKAPEDWPIVYQKK